MADDKTKRAVEPFGETIEELRHSWIMMAEAFSQPVLDFDNIPEPGYERKNDAAGSELDKRIKSPDSGEEERLAKEEIHAENFIGVRPLEELVRKIYTEYRDYIERDTADNPWKYSKGADSEE